MQISKCNNFNESDELLSMTKQILKIIRTRKKLITRKDPIWPDDMNLVSGPGVLEGTELGI